jgi:hypothetical protein
MKKRLCMLVCLFLLASVVVVCIRPKSSISFSSYQKITMGMPQAPVEAILGGPPRCEDCAENGHLLCGTTNDSGIGGIRPPPPATWCNKHICIYVSYSNGVVADKRYAFRVGREVSAWERTRAWLP